MRYYVIAQTRRSDLLRWFHFPDRRAWLDLETPQCVLQLQFLGDGAGALQVGVVDRDGVPLPCTTRTPDTVPPGRSGFPGQPPERRQFVEVAFEFPDPRPVTLVDTVTEVPLLTLTPELVFPNHVFALMEEARTGFAPDGFSNFIETGTLFGHTTLFASYWVDRAITIELSQELHAQATRHLAHRPNVTCLQGNSADRLPGVIADLAGPSFFFLDAHWSGDKDTDWEVSRFAGYPVDTARIDETALPEADRQVPLARELEQVVDGHAAPALILIDDWGGVGQRDFGFKGEDWSNLDAQALCRWMQDHPRTHAHFQSDPNRYVWMIT